MNTASTTPAVAAQMIGVDVGGTFTDIVKIEAGKIITMKVPTNPEASETSVLKGASGVGASDISVFNLASTAGLNAIITRLTPKVALLTTTGHRDLLDRGRLGRPAAALTDPNWRREFGDARRPLVERYLRRGINERITGTGEVLLPLDEEQARAQLDVLRRCEVEAVAVCLINSYVNPAHEQRLQQLVMETLGAIPCSISSEVSPLTREYVRGMTTLVDVIMKAKYSDYTERLAAGLAELGFDGVFNYSDCAARLLPADYAMERPYRLVVGGPAAGTAATAHFGRQLGEQNLLCADVGGTSCDISLVLGGEPWLNSTFELEHDLHVNALSTDVVTLGAGGGSIIWVNPTGEIRVGPESAGSRPGPACYGHGGARPTITDAAAMIGILAPDKFLGGEFPLRADLAEQAFSNLESRLPLSQRIDYAWRMGINNIAEGLVNICIRHGLDIREFSLMSFGAAGGMLLPSLLQVLPLRNVIAPPHPGLFSALGMLSADQVYSDHRTSYLQLNEQAAGALDQLFTSMEAGLRARLGNGARGARLQRSFDGCLMGQSFETPFVPVPDGSLNADALAQMVEDFHRVYGERNGNAFPHIPVQGVTYRVELRVPTEKVEHPALPVCDQPPASATTATLRHLDTEPGPAAVYDRDSLRAGQRFAGPAIVQEKLSTIFAPTGTGVKVGQYGELIISRSEV